MERLQRIIAHAGLASRRQAEEWILEGRITVNGHRIRELGTRADAAKDNIRVDGRTIRPAASRVCLAFHKPAGVITTMRDTEGRPSVADYLRAGGHPPGVVPAGRLDYGTSGLLLLTNDGDLAHRLTHPRYGVPKTYEVKLSGMPTEAQLDRLRRGVRLEDGATAPSDVRVLRRLKQKVWLRMELREGRNREIRRMVEAVGHTVERLVRSHFGPIALGQLERGEIRPLTEAEEKRLRRAVSL
ncbi:MAG: pseudouridine synthase [Deltaproteobacteria bacterium]|nr:pseudouridine synthase [Deltaproteobacteria bacterium]